MNVPKEYHGREQSFLKHRVLKDYLTAWGHKLGSVARSRSVRLCYVDAFAGPWQSKDENLNDTSIAIGLDALEQAATTWEGSGYAIRVEAYFVEKSQSAFERLEQHLAGRGGRVAVHPMRGEFGDHVDLIQQALGSDPSFIFVDPTGWKGAAMRFISPLLRGGPARDVMINVMFHHICRFKDDRRGFLREQMREFFGLVDADLPEGLEEEQLLQLYRTRLKESSRLKFAADLAIPAPLADRTKFRLVVGGNHPEVINLFRNVEAKVIGREAAEVRDAAAQRANEARTGQLSLLSAPCTTDTCFDRQHATDVAAVEDAVVATLAGGRKVRFDAMWPALLEDHHITKAELAEVVRAMQTSGRIEANGLSPRERTIKDEHILCLHQAH